MLITLHVSVLHFQIWIWCHLTRSILVAFLLLKSKAQCSCSIILVNIVFKNKYLKLWILVILGWHCAAEKCHSWPNSYPLASLVTFLGRHEHTTSVPNTKGCGTYSTHTHTKNQGGWHCYLQPVLVSATNESEFWNWIFNQGRTLRQNPWFQVFVLISSTCWMKLVLRGLVPLHSDYCPSNLILGWALLALWDRAF